MRIKRGVNRLGQESPSMLGTLGTIILIVIVIVLLILYFTGTLSTIFSKFGQAPLQDLEAVAQSCKFDVQNELKVDYCTFKPVTLAGQKQFINCDYNFPAKDFTSQDWCKQNGDDTAAKGYCTQLKTSQGTAFKPDKSIVNSKSCKDLGVV